MKLVPIGEIETSEEYPWNEQVIKFLEKTSSTSKEIIAWIKTIESKQDQKDQLMKQLQTAIEGNRHKLSEMVQGLSGTIHMMLPRVLN